MRSLIVKMLLFALLASVSSGAEVTPTFTYNEERSVEGSPHLSVTFPDGYTDSLILNKHGEGDDYCHYLGHLEKEREACVAMTGCIGQEDVHLTILSTHATRSASMLWRSTGSVEYIDPPLPSSGNEELLKEANLSTVKYDISVPIFLFAKNVLLNAENPIFALLNI